MAYKRRWQDDEVLICAEYYLLDGIVLNDLEQDFEMPHSTAYWCFVNRLPHLDFDLYKQVMKKIESNHYKAGRRKKA